MTTMPQNWKVRITESNREVLEQWRIKQPNVDQDPKITCLVPLALNQWLISGRGWDGSYMHWGDGSDYQEITFEEFKKYVLMEQQKIKAKPISMKCNQQQFDAIKPILEKHGLDIQGVKGRFELYPFLTNHYNYKKLHIGNIVEPDHSRPLMEDEEWNQDLFLRCCGIDPTPKFKVGDKVIIKKDSVGYGTGEWRGEFQDIIQTQGYLTIRWEYTNGDGTQQIIDFEESAYQADSRWLTHYTETKTEMKTYNIKISDLKKIHDVACSSWKTKIKALIVDPFADYIVLSQTQVDEMFKAAHPHQRPVLVEVFGEPVTQCPYKEGQLIWVWDFESKFPAVRKFLGMAGSKFEVPSNVGCSTTTWDCAAPFNNGQLPDQFKHLLENQ